MSRDGKQGAGLRIGRRSAFKTGSAGLLGASLAESARANVSAKKTKSVLFVFSPAAFRSTTAST